MSASSQRNRINESGFRRSQTEVVNTSSAYRPVCVAPIDIACDLFFGALEVVCLRGEAATKMVLGGFRLRAGENCERTDTVGDSERTLPATLKDDDRALDVTKSSQAPSSSVES